MDTKNVDRGGIREALQGHQVVGTGLRVLGLEALIIQRKLAEIPAGDVVFYCDVGRIYPFKKLETPITPLLDWMTHHGQTVMQGISIPWKGPMSMWTKRRAFVAKHMDLTEYHRATPIQASFSLWRSHATSIELVDEWMALSARRNLISDDPDDGELAPLPDFHENRHDQSLLSLCCLEKGIAGIDVGTEMPDVDAQHPTEIMQLMAHFDFQIGMGGNLLRALVLPIERIEQRLRTKVKFGEPRIEPTFINHKTLP